MELREWTEKGREIKKERKNERREGQKERKGENKEKISRQGRWL